MLHLDCLIFHEFLSDLRSFCKEDVTDFCKNILVALYICVRIQKNLELFN